VQHSRCKGHHPLHHHADAPMIARMAFYQLLVAAVMVVAFILGAKMEEQKKEQEQQQEEQQKQEEQQPEVVWLSGKIVLDRKPGGR